MVSNSHSSFDLAGDSKSHSGTNILNALINSVICFSPYTQSENLCRCIVTASSQFEIARIPPVASITILVGWKMTKTPLRCLRCISMSLESWHRLPEHHRYGEYIVCIVTSEPTRMMVYCTIRTSKLCHLTSVHPRLDLASRLLWWSLMLRCTE